VSKRSFDNTDFPLPGGEVASIGTHVGPDGELTLKLRLPTDYWSVTGVWRAAENTNYKGGKTVVTLDKRPE
jgi:hypothetical protein